MRAVMIANASELHRQGGKGLYDEALVMARRWGFPWTRYPSPFGSGTARRTTRFRGDGRYLARVIPDCSATFLPGEGHHLMYDRWREILSAPHGDARRPSERGAPAKADRPVAPSPSTLDAQLRLRLRHLGEDRLA